MNSFIQKENFYINLLNLSNDYICVKDLEHKIVYANESYIKFFWKSNKDEIIGKSIFDILPKEFANKIFEEEKKVLQGKSLKAIEQKHLNTKNEFCFIRTNFNPLYDETNKLIGFTEVSQDITEKKICESWVKEYSDFDFLTGLYSKKMFLEQAKNLLKICRRECEEALVYFVELNNFKDIYEKYDEETCNIVLKVITKRLQDAFRTSDLVCRYSDDEFVIFTISNDDKKATASIKENIIESISKQIETNDENINIECNIGSACYPNTSRELEELICLASQDMYKLIR